MKNVTPELIAKARTAKSAEELLELAKANNVELTAEEAKTYFEQLNANGAVSDDELNAVSGGNEEDEKKCFLDWSGDTKSEERTTSPLYSEKCPHCKANLTLVEKQKGGFCPVCRKEFGYEGL